MNADLVLTREERLENPGGIEHEAGVIWEGQTPDQPDPRFVKFRPGYGIRAIHRCLETYWLKDGITTIGRAITRWAPPSENDTDAYIADVCQHCSIQADAVVELDQVQQPLVKAIIQHENGRCIYSDGQISQGIALP